MEERKPCRRCQRAIDPYAAICPFCNWNQAAAPPPPGETPAPAANYSPPSETEALKRKAIYAMAGVLLLIASFAIGMVINRDDAPKSAPKELAEQAEEHNKENVATVTKPLRADTPLVPVVQTEQPITSAPVPVPEGGVPNDFQRTDATAVSAAEYAQIAKRVQASEGGNAAVTDPRTLTGPAYTPPPRRASPPRTGAAPSRSAPAARTAAARTRPVPQHQPLPRINARGTARLSMVIGADGRVKRVNVDKPIGGSTAQVLAAVRQWRFKPATENGKPVDAPYSVEISFTRD